MKPVRTILFVLLLVFEAVIQYAHSPFLTNATGIVAFLAWAAAMADADRASRLMSSILVAVGVTLFAIDKTSVLRAVVSFGQNANVLMIMALIPLVGLLINLGGYGEALGVVSKDVKKPFYLFAIALLLSYALGSVLLNAAIALVWTVLYSIVERVNKNPSDFLVASLPRGYDASLLWTPSSPAMATALALTAAGWTSVFLPGFLVSLTLLVLSAAVEVRGPLFAAGSAGLPEPPSPRTEPTDAAAKSAAWKKTGVLALGMGSFIAAIVLFQGAGWTVFQSMAPCIAGTLVVWSLLLRKGAETAKATVKYFSDKMPGLSNQFLLMTTAGFIGTALQTALARGIPGVTGDLRVSRLVFALAGSFLVWFISILGIHPLIGMAIVYSVITPFAAGLSPAYVSLTLMLGSALGFNISPVSATILVTSSCAGKNSVEVGVKRQWKYVTLAWLCCSLLLSVVTR